MVTTGQRAGLKHMARKAESAVVSKRQGGEDKTRGRGARVNLTLSSTGSQCDIAIACGRGGRGNGKQY